MMQQRLETLRAIELQFRDFIDSEFLWEWTGLVVNGTKLETNPTVFVLQALGLRTKGRRPSL